MINSTERLVGYIVDEMSDVTYNFDKKQHAEYKKLNKNAIQQKLDLNWFPHFFSDMITNGQNDRVQTDLRKIISREKKT